VTRRRIATAFFRQPAQGEIWPSILARLDAAAVNGPVTVVSAGCGTGEEPYSVAMLMIERDIGGQVLASDVDPELLGIARRPIWTVRRIRQDVADGRLTAEQVRSHLEPCHAGRYYRPTTRLRERVQFDRLELGVDPVPACDLALVRNVWRHVTPERQRSLAGHLAAALGAEGVLIIGDADTWTPRVRQELRERPGTAAAVRAASTAINERFTCGENPLVCRPR
jgi:chemotaxis protein methyltransferase CheR